MYWHQNYSLLWNYVYLSTIGIKDTHDSRLYVRNVKEESDRILMALVCASSLLTAWCMRKARVLGWKVTDSIHTCSRVVYLSKNMSNVMYFYLRAFHTLNAISLPCPQTILWLPILDSATALHEYFVKNCVVIRLTESTQKYLRSTTARNEILVNIVSVMHVLNRQNYDYLPISTPPLLYVTLLHVSAVLTDHHEALCTSYKT